MRMHLVSLDEMQEQRRTTVVASGQVHSPSFSRRSTQVRFVAGIVFECFSVIACTLGRTVPVRSLGMEARHDGETVRNRRSAHPDVAGTKLSRTSHRMR